MNEYRPPRFNKFSKKQPNCVLYLGIVNNWFTKPSIPGSEQLLL